MHVGFGFNWSPAMVSFFGFGGGLGWVALAPFELFHPWWGHGFGGFGAFRGYDIHGFRNAGIRGGAITAGFNSFAGAGHRFNVATAGQLRSASMFRGSIPVSPNAASYRFSDRAVSANPRFSQAAARPFFSRPQQSFNNARGSSFGNARPAPAASGGGWQRFGQPAPQHTQSQGFASRPGGNGNSESGWHGFGTPQAPRYSAPSAPSYGGGYRAPAAPSYNNSYRAPAAAPHYSAPSAPRYNAPHYNAPKAQSAPKINSGGGGGGGGGKHFGGGGGGGKHR